MKQQLAVIAQRMGVDTGWGWPFPENEPEAPRLGRPWPSVLGQLLGDRYECRNFGVCGTTLLVDGHNPCDSAVELCLFPLVTGSMDDASSRGGAWLA